MGFDDNLSTWIQTTPGIECGDTWWYDSTGTLRMLVSNGNGYNLSMPSSGNPNTNAVYHVRY